MERHFALRIAGCPRSQRVRYRSCWEKIQTSFLEEPRKTVERKFQVGLQTHRRFRNYKLPLPGVKGSELGSI
jgi:hypothetical protein